MKKKNKIEFKIPLADMHYDGVYFDPNILQSLRTQKSILDTKPFKELNN